MLSHRETYDTVCEARTKILNLMFGLIPYPELYEKAEEILKMLKPVSDSEHKHFVNEIQTNPIAEWKP